MTAIERSASVPYGVEQMLTLVNDIDAYPDFLHWCHAARIEKSDAGVVEAALDVGIKGIYKTIRTRNSTRPPGEGAAARIDIEMIEGPLKRLHGCWEFESQESGGTDVRLKLEYEVHLSPLGLILGTLFDEIAHSQLRAFVRRADQVYGTSL
jgi:ribosome-associated toxin RatA of RatAB toxin-antitoxin module